MTWYAKSGSSSQQLDANRQLEEEKRRLKEQDEDLINQAIGVKVQKRKFVENQIDETELKQILSKGNIERESIDIERVKGIGSAPVKSHDHIEKVSSVSREIMKLQKQMEPSSEPSSSSSSSLSLLDNSSSSHSNIIPLKRKSDDIIESKTYSTHEDRDDKHSSSSSSREHTHSHKHKKEKKEHKHKKDHKKDHKKEKKDKNVDY